MLYVIVTCLVAGFVGARISTYLWENDR